MVLRVVLVFSVIVLCVLCPPFVCVDCMVCFCFFIVGRVLCLACLPLQVFDTCTNYVVCTVVYVCVCVLHVCV